MSGLLSPIQFIGERKGTLTVIVAAKFYFGGTPEVEDYLQQLQTICNGSSHGDSWPVELGMFDRSPNYPPTSPHQTEVCGIINAENHKIIGYLRNIDSLWELGTKSFKPKVNVNCTSIAPPLPTPPSPI